MDGRANMSKLRMAIRVIAFSVVIAALIFGCAGRWDFPFVWGVLGVMVAFYVALLAFADPDLIRERLKPGTGNRDRLTQPVGSLFLLTHWAVVGFDLGRFQWSLVPWQVQAVGLVGYAVALSVNFWAMRTNKFYSSVVRVQTDRSQPAVDGGPYRFVRHPGYAATLVATISGGLALGSWLALIPALGFAGMFVRRTILEDRLLQSELPGYSEYAQRVRHRLIPGVF